MRSLLLSAAAMLAATGCIPPHTQVSEANLQAQGRFSIIDVGGGFSYLIDPRTETCFLRQLGSDFNFALVAVPCDKLKHNLPEAASHIPWVPDAPPSSAPATPSST
ncbi:hypothetical protein JY651_44790 [Pyxidicoccus parkwayensis]|uniref:Lipoprotein n=1 Tax=Pyxidicoccus parkwayensis TaxID=2813578 RepID=A0ABX7NTQ0_9BACT|nr:hypothetical protein [Pyxidicoccus parkwaysis]QSQ22175.1 hypothetical protein JY651_44790 [Pyxidicoccus parkwaysis]